MTPVQGFWMALQDMPDFLAMPAILPLYLLTRFLHTQERDFSRPKQSDFSQHAMMATHHELLVGIQNLVMALALPALDFIKEVLVTRALREQVYGAILHEN